MTVRVFFEEAEGVAEGQTVTLDAEESHYLVRVRRSRAGRSIQVLDGRGGVWNGTVDRADASRCICTVLDRVELPSPPRALTLLLGFPDPRATLNAVTIASEVGVMQVMLVRCRRSPAAPPSAARIQRTLRAAQRQCGRGTPPSVIGPFDFEDAVASDPTLASHFAWEDRRGHDSPAPSLPPSAPARLLVGPEGGLTEAEAEILSRHEFIPLSLGPWILRTETATAAGLTRLLWA